MVFLDELLAAPDFNRAAQELAGDFRKDHGLGAVHQLGLAVPEVEAAAALLEARGIGPFFIAGGAPVRWTERGEERTFRGKLGLAYHRGLELELLEPGEGSDFYGRSVDPDGRIVVQHVGLLVKDVDREAATLAGRGHPIYVRGLIKTGPLHTDFAYMDTEPACDIVVEFISWKLLGIGITPFPALIHMLGRIEVWSGRRSISV